MKKLNQMMKDLESNLESCNVYVNLDDYETAKELIDAVEGENMTDEDVIYYHTAMEFLMEHDASLSESLSIASDMGYDPSDLSSEILATILKSEMNRNEFYELEGEIEEYYEAKEEEEEEEEAKEEEIDEEDEENES